MRKVALAVCYLSVLLGFAPRGRAVSFDPLSQDPPVLNREFPGSIEFVTIMSGGEGLDGRMFVAQGRGPHATVLIARGLPDYVGNLDLAMVLQRAGFNVLSFNYRGFWGSGGTYSLMNSLQDVEAAIAFIRSAETAKKMRADPKGIILLGYSLGGPVVLRAGADPDIRAVAVIDGTDVRSYALDTPAGYESAVAATASSSAVRIVSGKVVIDELRSQWNDWNPINSVPGLTGKDVLLLYAAKGNGSLHLKPELGDVLAAKTRLTRITLDTDHSFLDHRVVLMRTVLKWVQSLRKVRS